jgi:FMN phosphatase YigB (HAD superfamily)
MLNATRTQSIAKSFYNRVLASENAGMEACLLNLQGDKAFMNKLFAVRGFKELLAAALPPSQRTLGHLAN